MNCSVFSSSFQTRASSYSCSYKRFICYIAISIVKHLNGSICHMSLLITCHFFITEEADFNSTVIEITYPVDEGLHSPIANVRASIPVVNDTIDEAEEQFIAFLEVTDAINLGHVIVDNSVRNTAICFINDDDRKLVLIKLTEGMHN